MLSHPKPVTSYQALTASATPIGPGLPDRLRQMNGLFSNKKLGVWDAMTLAADQRHKQEDQEKKIRIKRQQAELR